MKKVIIKKGVEKVIVAEKAGNVRFVLDEGARLTYVLVSGSGWAGRPVISFECRGRGSSVDFLGLIAGSKNGNFHFEAESRHTAAKTGSRMQLFSVMSGRSNLDFHGNIVIKKGADLSEAHMAHRTLLLTPGARVRTLPSLEIGARNVKAGHAATIGKVDRDMLYYLESRGIDPSKAKHLLIRAFLEGPIAQIQEPAKREVVRNKVNHLLESI